MCPRQAAPTLHKQTASTLTRSSGTPDGADQKLQAVGTCYPWDSAVRCAAASMPCSLACRPRPLDVSYRQGDSRGSGAEPITCSARLVSPAEERDARVQKAARREVHGHHTRLSDNLRVLEAETRQSVAEMESASVNVTGLINADHRRASSPSCMQRSRKGGSRSSRCSLIGLQCLHQQPLV